MGDEALRARRLERGTAEQRARLERRAVLRQLEQRRARPRADDLEEAEAVDRGPLERLRQDRVDRRRGRLALRLAADGRQVDADRAADVEPADGLRPPPRRRPPQARPAADSRRRRSGSSPASAKSAARRRRSGRCRCALPRSGRPSRRRRARLGRRESGSVPRRAAARSSGFVGDPRERPLPRLGAGDRLARHFDGRASRLR